MIAELRRNQANDEQAGITLALVLSIVTAMALGLVLVWLAIHRTDLGYDLPRLRSEAESRERYQAKLEVERERLLSPYILEAKARELGLRDARPGQIRRLDTSGKPMLAGAAETAGAGGKGDGDEAKGQGGVPPHAPAGG